jgi:hypothetical protein
VPENSNFYLSLKEGSLRNLSGRAISCGVHSGHMVNTLFRRHGLHILRGEGIRAGFDAALILIEVGATILEEADQPDLVVDLADPSDLAREDLTEVGFPSPRQMSPNRVTRTDRS